MTVQRKDKYRTSWMIDLKLPFTGVTMGAYMQYFYRLSVTFASFIPKLMLSKGPSALLLSTLWLIPALLSAQTEPLAIGQWRAVLPYTTGMAVAQTQDHIYYGTTQALVRIDKEDQSPRFYSRIDGLSESGIRQMAYSDRFKTLVLAYNSGNIDLMTQAGVFNVPDILNNTNITGDKTINHIYLYQDSLVLLSCGFGMVQYNLATRLFERTAFSPFPIFQMTAHDGYFYAAGEEGLFRLPVGSFFSDFGRWALLGQGEGLPDVYVSAGVVMADGQLFAAVNDTLMRLHDQGRELVFHQSGLRLRYMAASREHVLAGYQVSGGPARMVVRSPDGDVRTITECVGVPRGALLDQYDRIWYADEWSRFRTYNLQAGRCEWFLYNTPAGFSSWDIHILEDTVYIASGAYSAAGSPTGNNSGLYILRDGQWTNYNRSTHPVMESMQAHVDYVAIVADPRDGTVYAGSYYGGLLEIKGDDLHFYQRENSILQGSVGDIQRPRIGGVVRDRKGNYWMSNSLAPDPLVLLTADGQWRSFRPGNNTFLLRGIVDHQNNKWFVLGNGGVLVYNEGNDPLDPSDDQVRILTADNANLPDNRVRSLGLDRDGAVWIGTRDGVGVVRCGDVFRNECRASRVVVTSDGDPEALLKDVEITAIAVDGANRKWLGTGNGLFVQSPDGTNEVARFTMQNSPLPSGRITALAFNDRSAEMWIGTENGMMVYQTDAPVGDEVHAPQVSVYPNPVRPDYRGPIAVNGLPRDANVKITDIRGRLVYETTALGGQAIWYGEDYTGRRVASGVYLVFSSSKAGGFIAGKADTAVSKIVFVH
jgi:hypothetical protein